MAWHRAHQQSFGESAAQQLRELARFYGGASREEGGQGEANLFSMSSVAPCRVREETALPG